MNKISRSRFMAGTRPHTACTFTSILIINWIRDIIVVYVSYIDQSYVIFSARNVKLIYSQQQPQNSLFLFKNISKITLNTKKSLQKEIFFSYWNILIWSRHCLDASTSFLSDQCVYI